MVIAFENHSPVKQGQQEVGSLYGSCRQHSRTGISGHHAITQQKWAHRVPLQLSLWVTVMFCGFVVQIQRAGGHHPHRQEESIRRGEVPPHSAAL